MSQAGTLRYEAAPLDGVPLGEAFQAASLVHSVANMIEQYPQHTRLFKPFQFKSYVDTDGAGSRYARSAAYFEVDLHCVFPVLQGAGIKMRQEIVSEDAQAMATYIKGLRAVEVHGDALSRVRKIAEKYA